MNIGDRRTDLPVLLLHNIDPKWRKRDRSYAHESAEKLLQGLSDEGHPVASVVVDRPFLESLLEEHEPEQTGNDISEIQQTNDSEFTVHFHQPTATNRPKYDEQFPATIVNKLAPEKIMDYFFFDGEQLEDYFETSNTKVVIKDAVLKVSQLDLLEKIIELFTDEGDVVIDPVAGSGSTLIAAINKNRKTYGFEIKKNFFNLANKWIVLTKEIKKHGYAKTELINNKNSLFFGQNI